MDNMKDYRINIHILIKTLTRTCAARYNRGSLNDSPVFYKPNYHPFDFFKAKIGPPQSRKVSIQNILSIIYSFIVVYINIYLYIVIQNVPRKTLLPLIVVLMGIKWNTVIHLISRPGQSKGLLYKHFCHSLIISVSHWFFVKISLRRLHGLMVEDGAFIHKIDYVTIF